MKVKKLRLTLLASAAIYEAAGDTDVAKRLRSLSGALKLADKLTVNDLQSRLQGQEHESM